MAADPDEDRRANLFEMAFEAKTGAMLRKTLPLVCLFTVYLHASDAPEDILGKMTLEEKVAQLHQGEPMEAGGVARLGLAPLKMTDGPKGIRGMFFSRERASLARNLPACV